ncbi:helix-turn-helix domain-containing protein [Chloroflexota bacterium]
MDATMATDQERLTLTVPEVAALLRISRGAAYEAVRTGALPGVFHFGRTIRISKYAIDQLLQCSESYQAFDSTDPSKTDAHTQTAEEERG